MAKPIDTTQKLNFDAHTHHDAQPDQHLKRVKRLTTYRSRPRAKAFRENRRRNSGDPRKKHELAKYACVSSCVRFGIRRKRAKRRIGAKLSAQTYLK